MRVLATCAHARDSQLLLNLLGFPLLLEQSPRSSTALRVGIVLLLVFGVLSCEEDSVSVKVQTDPKEICQGHSADAAGNEPASASIQACIDATPSGETLRIPRGVYKIDKQILIDKSITITTEAVGAHDCHAKYEYCATLRAAPDFFAENGFVRVVNTENVKIDHLIIDGNRESRMGSQAAEACGNALTRNGFSVTSHGCSHCSWTNNVLRNTLCGTALEWIGDNGEIKGNYFVRNGDHETTYLWSDGLTLLSANHVSVVDNYFSDNTDIDLILGGSIDGLVANNLVEHFERHTFAGIMLDNFNGTQTGDFTDFVLDSNTIKCSSLCDFGLQIGPHAWYPSKNTIGGRIQNNTVYDARIGINVDGAGTTNEPVVIHANSVSRGSSTPAHLCNGELFSMSINVSEDSSVVFSENIPNASTSVHIHACP